MKDIAIFGAGGFGKEVACLINRINATAAIWNFIGFFDDTKSKGEACSHYGKILGGIRELNEWESSISLIIAVGSPESISLIKNRIINPNVSFPNLIDPSFKIIDSKSFSIGCGNIIQGGCSVSCDVKIGDFNVLNGDVALGHDVIVGDFNVIMPAVRISGNVTMCRENLIGAGSIIIQKIKMGSRVKLGAGAVLMTKPKDNSLYLGNPARLFKY